MGSYTVVGCHASWSFTSEMMAAARVGEHMKWRIRGRDSLVSAKSRGVIRKRGVRYSNLPMSQSVSIDGLPQLDGSPSVLPGVRIQCTSGSAVWIVTVKPHVRTVHI